MPLSPRPKTSRGSAAMSEKMAGRFLNLVIFADSGEFCSMSRLLF